MSKQLIWIFLGIITFSSACADQHLQLNAAPRTPFINVPTAPTVQHASNCRDDLPPDIRFGIKQWPNTDFCQHSIPYEAIMGIVGRDSIAALDDPAFESNSEADLWLTDQEPVQVLEIGDDARAYPLPILIWHEIVNDTVSGVPVVVTYCPLCNAALVFERTLDGRILDFSTTGNLRNADLIMYDRQTESWWQQFEGQAIVGELTDRTLPILPSSIVAYADFKAQHPDGQVLSIFTGFDRRYGETPYINYDSLANNGTGFFDGQTDDRLPPKMRVLALTLDGTAVAYPFNMLAEKRVINDTVNNQPLVAFWKSGTLSPVFAPLIFESKDIGSAAAFSRELDGRMLTFQPRENGLYADQETGSQWNIFGSAVSGPLKGDQLTPLAAHEFFWFVWAEFQPETILKLTKDE